MNSGLSVLYIIYLCCLIVVVVVVSVAGISIAIAGLLCLPACFACLSACSGCYCICYMRLFTVIDLYADYLANTDAHWLLYVHILPINSDISAKTHKAFW